ncbi:MAG TPA: hypothetical protein VF188_01010 [Longimicrobiales bacterium]
MTETVAYRRTKRRYVKEFGAAMLGYGVVLVASLMWLEAHPESAWRVPVSVAPVVPIGLALWAAVRLFRRLDELHRRIQVEALAFAFTGSALFVITYGFLEGAGFPKLTMWWAWTVMGVLWGVGHCIARWRYR